MTVFPFTFTVTPELPVGAHSAPPGLRIANAQDIRQTTILSKADWSRIQNQLNKKAIEEERMRRNREEKERLKNLNKEQIQHWTNTIAVSNSLPYVL